MLTERITTSKAKNVLPPRGCLQRTYHQALGPDRSKESDVIEIAGL
jgi:hypothetical protein